MDYRLPGTVDLFRNKIDADPPHREVSMSDGQSWIPIVSEVVLIDLVEIVYDYIDAAVHCSFAASVVVVDDNFFGSDGPPIVGKLTKLKGRMARTVENS